MSTLGSWVQVHRGMWDPLSFRARRLSDGCLGSLGYTREGLGLLVDGPLVSLPGGYRTTTRGGYWDGGGRPYDVRVYTMDFRVPGRMGYKCRSCFGTVSVVFVGFGSGDSVNVSLFSIPLMT